MSFKLNQFKNYFFEPVDPDFWMAEEYELVPSAENDRIFTLHRTDFDHDDDFCDDRKGTRGRVLGRFNLPFSMEEEQAFQMLHWVMKVIEDTHFYSYYRGAAAYQKSLNEALTSEAAISGVMEAYFHSTGRDDL